MDDADDDFAVDAESDGDAEVRDAVVVVHRAIDGVDDPLAGRFLVACNSFFAVERVTLTSS